MSSCGQFSPASRRSSADRSAAIPLFVAAVVQSFIRRLVKLEFDIDEPIRHVNGVLDPTAVFTGRAPGSLPRQ